MYWCIAPPFVKEAPSTVEMLKVILIWLAAPKLHVGNLKIAPEVTRAVPTRLLIMTRPPLTILYPIPCVIFVQIFRVLGNKLFCRCIQSGYRLWRIVKIDSKTIRLIVVLHPTKYVVVNVTEEVYFWLDAPIVASIRQRGVLVEHAAVPAAHLVVADHVAILHVLLIKDIGGLVKKVAVDPGRDRPVLLGNEF